MLSRPPSLYAGVGILEIVVDIVNAPRLRGALARDAPRRRGAFAWDAPRHSAIARLLTQIKCVA